MRVALYVRVSTEEQKAHGVSVDSQIEALQEYAKENNHVVVGIYDDAGISARKTYKKRPALLELLKDCQAHDIELILFTKLDRWFRSVGDYYEVQKILDECHVPWRAIWEDYETQTANGIFKVNIMLSVAQSEADRTSERIKKIFEYKKEKGEVCSGAVAIGYKIENKKWVFDDNIAPAVRIFYDHYLSTFNYRESYELAKAHGLCSSYRATLSLIQNPHYYGDASYISEGYITKEQFELIKKHRAFNPKVNKFDYVFRGICVCGFCGSPLAGKSTIYKNKDGSEKRAIQYICSRHCHNYDCKGSTISETALNEFLMNRLESEIGSYNIKITTAAKSKNATSVASIRAKLIRIKNLYELGDMSFDEYKEKRALLMTELDRLEATPKRQVIQIPTNWKEIYEQLDANHKNAFWINILDHIEVTGRKCTKPILYF